MSEIDLSRPAGDAGTLSPATTSRRRDPGHPFRRALPAPGHTAGCADAPAAIRAARSALRTLPIITTSTSTRRCWSGRRRCESWMPGTWMAPRRRGGNAARAEAAVRICCAAGGPDRARRRRLGSDPGASGLRRRQTRHRPAGRRTPRFPRRGRRRAGRLLIDRCVAPPRWIMWNASCRSGCAESAAPAPPTWPMRAPPGNRWSPRRSCARGGRMAPRGVAARRTRLRRLRPRWA